MSNFKSIITLTLSFIFLNVYSSPEFYLFTTLYNENRSFRVKEYQTCIDKNCENPFIKEIIIFLEKTNKFKLDHPKIKIVPILERPSYASFMEYADNHNKYKNKLIMIANGDIYFDNSLKKFDKFNWHNKFIALTRHQAPGTIKWNPSKISHDVWIYKNPIEKHPSNDLKLGLGTHDNRFLYQMLKNKYIVINPHLDVFAWHYDSVEGKNKLWMQGKESWLKLSKHPEFYPALKHCRKIKFTKISSYIN